MLQDDNLQLEHLGIFITSVDANEIEIVTEIN